mgnify:CR=1 FL=1
MAFFAGANVREAINSGRADFIPIARFTEGPMVIVVNDQTPYKTLKELVDDAKKRPDEISYSSSGVYGTLHMAMEMLTHAAFPIGLMGLVHVSNSIVQHRRPRVDETLDLEVSLEGAESTVTRTSGCPVGVDVELWTIVGGAHIPGLSPTFTPMVVDWLFAHPKP